MQRGRSKTRSGQAFAPRGRHKIRTALATLLLATFAGALLAPAATAGVRVPSSGIWLGAFPDASGGNDRALAEVEHLLGRKIKIVNKYHSFSNHSYAFERHVIAGGRIPLISWRATEQTPDRHRASKIASGRYDGLIRATASAIKQLRGRVLIRFNWEMDQSPGDRQYIGTPTQFVRAWRRIVSIFRARRVTNAEFVWAPRAGSFNKGEGQHYYPGPGWVDWIGGSAVPVDHFAGFRELFGRFYGWASRQPKPVLIWVGVRERPGAPAWKSAFFQNMSRTVRGWRRAKALVYYHARTPKGMNYFIDTSSGALRAFRRMSSSNYFTPGIGDTLM